MGRMQAVMGRRFKSICETVVELVGLHYVITILMHHIITNNCLGPIPLA